MRTHKKRWKQLLAAVIAAGLLAGCGGSRSTASGTASYAMDGAVGMTEMASPTFESENSGSYKGSGAVDSTLTPADPAATEQKIVYTASVRMESTDYDASVTALQAAANDTGAYFESTSLSGEAGSGGRSAYYTVRVPVTKYRDFLTAVGEAGSVLNLSENADDITASYLDTEARLNALTAQRDRLNALAEKAETTADLLEIESQLSDVQYQIESYTSQKRYMDSQVSYSTVDITLREVVTLTPTSVLFSEQLVDAFRSGVTAFVDFIKGLVLTVVFLAPLLLCLAVVVLVILLATRKRRAARKAARLAARLAVRHAQTDPGTAGTPAAPNAPNAPYGTPPRP